MTETGQFPEPTNADILAAIQHLSTSVAGLTEGQENLVGRLDALEDRMLNRFDQVRADLAGLKVDVGMLERYQRDTAEAVRRHVASDDHHRHAA